MGYIEQALKSVTVITNSKTSTYYNDEGIKVPRVTEIISTMIHNDNLMYWANSLGMKGEKYRDVLNKASNTGTEAHTAIELFLNNRIECTDNTPFLGFLLWYNLISSQNIPIEIIYVEHKIISKWFGGTLDALIRIGNKIFLIDFKTSNHITYNYFLQLGAYRYMLRDVEGIVIDGTIVLQLNKFEPGFEEYMLIFDNKDHLNFMNQCEHTFLSLVYGYFNIKQVERQFNKIFK